MFCFYYLVENGIFARNILLKLMKIIDNLHVVEAMISKKKTLKDT